MSTATIKTEFGRRIWLPGPRLRQFGFREVDLGGEDDPLANYRAAQLNADAAAALKRRREHRRTKRAA